MKLIKKENIGIHPVLNTNVEDVYNYVGNNCVNHNCIVDYTYKGEIHLSVINTSTQNVRIYENMKILQFLETPIFHSLIEVTESFYDYVGPSKPGQPVSPGEEKFYKGLQDDRGTGGFGSSNE
jgi:deoxycytidine triphosphate deaminase